MMTILAFIIETLTLYLLSRTLIKNLFAVLMRLSGSKKTAFYLLALFFFPGTIVHEFAHFFTALILFLKVEEINIFPHFEGDYLKLGSVKYQRRDFLRSTIVGISPFFVGIGIFFVIDRFSLFPQNSLLANIIFGYLIFSISSMMFSSKQDLKNLIYIIPFIIVFFGFLYIFDINLFIFFNRFAILEMIERFLKSINFYLLFSIFINILLLLCLYTLNRLPLVGKKSPGR